MKIFIVVLILGGIALIADAGVGNMEQVIAGLIVFYAGIVIGIIKVIQSMGEWPDEY